MAEYVQTKEISVSSGETIEIKNDGFFSFEVRMGIVFNNDGEYHVSVHNGKIIVTTERRTNND